MTPNSIAAAIAFHDKRHLRGQRQRRWMRWFIAGVVLYGVYAVIWV